MTKTAQLGLTPEQVERRRSYIGASDAAAILGLSPYKNAHSVWAEKMGLAPDMEATPVMEAGHRVEPIILDWCESQLDVVIERDVHFVAANGIMATNLDGWIPGDREVVEAKSTGEVEDWGPPDTDEVPEHVLVQVHHQMICAGAPCTKAWVPVLKGRHGLKLELYRVPFNRDLGGLLEEQLCEWWTKHVIGQTPPPEDPEITTVRRYKRVEGKGIEVADELYEAVMGADEAYKAASKHRSTVRARLLDVMGDAEVGRCSLGVITYLKQTRRAYQVKGWSGRVLRLKHTKQGNVA